MFSSDTGLTKVDVHPSLDEILKDFPPGPLDRYRNKASFDWKQMKIFWDGEDCTLFKVSIELIYYVLFYYFLYLTNNVDAKRSCFNKIISIMMFV